MRNDDMISKSEVNGVFPAERISELRDSMELSQIELSNMIHVSRSSMSAYEKGTTQPPLTVLLQLADLFHVSLDYLMGRTDIKMDINSLEAKLKTRSGAVPIDMIFRLNDMDKEVVGMLLYSYMQKQEYQKK